MIVIAARTIREYSLANAQAAEALRLWYHQVTEADWPDYNAIRAAFPSADYIADNRYIFNIKGNHYRLLAMVFFSTRTVYIRRIFTHAEYSKLNKAQLSTL